VSPRGHSRLPSLAAWLPPPVRRSLGEGGSAASGRVVRVPGRATLPRKPRVGGCRVRPSGRSSRRGHAARGIATGCRGSAGKTALGRSSWLNRDPIGEKGGANLYGFVRNASVSAFDPNGQESWIPTPDERLWRCNGCGPSWLDHLGPGLGGISTPEVDQTEWFEHNYHGWSKYAQSQFSSLIDAQIQSRCSGKSIYDKTRFSVYPYYSDGSLTKPVAVDMGDGGETRFGDAPQNKWSATAALGSFWFRLDGPASVSYFQDSSSCCPNGGQMRRYAWEADLVVADVLGSQPGDRVYMLDGPELTPERGVIRARWKLRGSGSCCSKAGR